MPITPTNQSKTTITPSGQRKTGVYLWGDAIATWGDSVATWGNYFISPVNESKNPYSSITIDAGQPMGLLLAITYPSQVVVGSGVVNQSKS